MALGKMMEDNQEYLTENLRRTGAFLRSIRPDKNKLLPYHDAARVKYRALGKADTMPARPDDMAIRLNRALALLEGGIAGNMVDRIFRAAVIDFLDFHIAGYHWPAFNIADSAICVSIALLLYIQLFPAKKPSTPVDVVKK